MDINVDASPSNFAERARPTSELWLLAITFLTNILIVANPGFYSHDEWQKYDSLQQYDFLEYIRQYGVLRAGPDFGFPVRPLGFIQQGFGALFMQHAPFITHGLDVLIHGVVVVVLFRFLLACGTDRRKAGYVAALFAISPLTTFSTGWVGASFDRLYILFGLLAAWVFVLSLQRGMSPFKALLLLLLSACAILSKETAVMTPLMLAGLSLFMAATGTIAFNLRRTFVALTCVSVPIALYLLIRAPALYASFFSHVHGAYAPSSINLEKNLLLYAAQPFFIGTADLASAQLLPMWRWILALGMHIALVLVLGFRFNWKIAGFYIFAYFVYLIPVLPVPIQGAHYLYGSAVPFSIAFGYALLPDSGGIVRTYLIGFIVLLLILSAHAFEIQATLYTHGVCQRRFLDTLDSHLDPFELKGNKEVAVYVQEGAPGYIARQATFARSPYTDGTGIGVSIHDPAAGDLSKRPASALLMHTNCEVSY